MNHSKRPTIVQLLRDEIENPAPRKHCTDFYVKLARIYYSREAKIYVESVNNSPIIKAYENWNAFNTAQQVNAMHSLLMADYYSEVTAFYTPSQYIRYRTVRQS